MNFDLNNYNEVHYWKGKIFFDKRCDFHKHLGHSYRTKRFPHHESVLAFVAANPEVGIYFTLDETIKPFRKIDKGYILHMDSYINFCSAIKSSTKGRVQAFLSHTLNLKDISATQADKDEYIKANATEKNLLAAIESLPASAQQNISILLQHLQTSPETSASQSHEVTVPEFLRAFTRFLTDTEVQTAFVRNIPQVQIQILKNHIDFLKANLDKNETFIQNWIDEEDGKYRKLRCLIFGVEYIDPKREGRLSGKKFDVLAEQNRNHHVIIELKSPNANVFDVVSRDNNNEGMVNDYSLSKELSRAILQVLGYKKWYTNATTEEIEELGLAVRKKISVVAFVYHSL